MSVRRLNYHEQKLLRKVDFLNWKSDGNHRQSAVLQRYHIQDAEDYTKYNKMVGQITKICAKLAELDPKDPVRIKMSHQLTLKLYNMGLIHASTGLLSDASKVNVSALCRRRLPVVMVRLKMAQTVRQAVELVEQGHVRVGPNCVADPAFLVTRSMEDFVTWVDDSKIKKTIHRYQDKHDDFELMGN